MTTAAPTIVFRLPRLAYVVVLFLLFSAFPLALATRGGDSGSTVGLTWRAVLLVVPLVAAVFIARTATFASSSGLRVRAAFGSRSLGWNEIRGLTVNERNVYAVVDDGAVRLPCVRINDLTAIARISEGRLPELAEPRPKFAAQRRRR